MGNLKLLFFPYYIPYFSDSRHRKTSLGKEDKTWPTSLNFPCSPMILAWDKMRSKKFGFRLHLPQFLARIIIVYMFLFYPPKKLKLFQN